MKYSSANQLQFDYATTTSGQSSQIGGEDSPPAAATEDSLKIPDFGHYDPAIAAAAKIAGRINAANISDRDLDELLAERKRLLDKQFDETITRKESNRLDYVHWTLDRIEDARSGQALEALEGYAAQYKAFLDDLNKMQEQLSARLPKKKRR
jgi:hypothetical protein